jgi:hypothetical protein
VTAWLAHIYGLLLPPRLALHNPWRTAALKTADLLLRLSAVMLIGTLREEFLAYTPDGAFRAHVLAAAVLITILGACGLALYTALGQSNQLSERKRINWVYIAEGLLAVAFIHLRLTEPQLFTGWLRPWWPLVIMLIAFVGAGAAELFQRQGRRVLSQPLWRTGIFLPLLPAIGWWLTPGLAIGFGQMLLVIAAFYAILAAVRRSLGLAALAALFGNGAMWDALARSPSLGFLEHPQLWLIPAAASILAGAQLNRERLTRDRLATLRYLALLLIYVSSTADVFLNGVSRAPWLPLVLAAFSVAGVFLGMLWRIRAFLFLGLGFLLLAVVTMIWYASSEYHWTWIWYVAGIGLGTFIIAVFALFEKKREQMLALIEGLKKWE